MVGLIVGSAQWCFAERVSSDKAIDIAESFFKKNVLAKKGATKSPKMRISHERTTRTGEPTFFVASDDAAKCFVIVSGDDRLPAVLGWSECGAFDEDNLPPNLRELLAGYEAEISAALQSESISTRAILTPTYHPAIAPICKTKWGQGAPANLQCPESEYAGYKSLAGCVAVAMAQVMKTHEWPVKSSGEREGFKFGTKAFDWKNMLDEYPDDKYSDAQAQAIAQLMSECGRSVDMSYGYYSSGAHTRKVPFALSEYFGYSKDASIKVRRYYRSAEWDEMLYQELSAGRAMVYSGDSQTDGGHAFVCDGYLEGYFHFNWGWWGYGDGYFLTNILNPDRDGRDLYEDGYNGGQEVVTNIYKDNGATTRQNLIASSGGFNYDGTRFYAGFYEGKDYGLFYNGTSYSVTADFGIRVENNATGAESFYTAYKDRTLEGSYGFKWMDVPQMNLADGEYKVSPVYNVGGRGWENILIPYGDQTYLTAKVSGGTIRFSNPGIPAGTEGKVILSDPIYIGARRGCDPISAVYYVTNVGPGDYYDTLTAKLYETKSQRGETVSRALHLASGQTKMVSFTFLPNENEDLTLRVMDERKSVYIKTPFEYGGDAEDLRPADRKVDFDLIVNPYQEMDKDPVLAYHLKNHTDKEYSSEIYINLYGPDLESMGYWRYASYMFPANYEAIVNGIPFEFERTMAGTYFWRVTDADGNVLSLTIPQNFRRKVGADGLYAVSLTSLADDLMFSRPPKGSYAGALVIPEKLADGTVTEIEGNALINSPELTAVSIPATVTRLGSGLLYMTPKLRHLTVNSAIPFDISPDLMEPERFGQVTLHVPDGSLDLYRAAEVWKNFNITTSAVDELPAEPAASDSAAIYTLDGLRVNPAAAPASSSGLYIVNGRKLINP